MDNLIPIGRFSRVSRLSIKALRHYADAGLLVPAWVDPSSGYRYYTYAQATQAEVIRVLRSLDMPLDEIGEVLAADDDVVAKLMDRHYARLGARLDHHSRMLAFLRRLIEEEGRPMPYEVTVKEIPAQHVAVVRCRVTAQTIGDDVGRAFGTLMGAVGQSGAGFAGPPFLVMTEVVDTDGSGEGAIEVGVPVEERFAGLGEVTGEEWPTHLVAATMHRGRYDEEGPAYAAVEEWIQQHGHSGAGAPREVYLTSPADTPDPADYLTEIQFPIVVPA